MLFKLQLIINKLLQMHTVAKYIVLDILFTHYHTWMFPTVSLNAVNLE